MARCRQRSGVRGIFIGRSPGTDSILHVMLVRVSSCLAGPAGVAWQGDRVGRGENLARKEQPRRGRSSAVWWSPASCWPCPADCCRCGAITSSRISAPPAIIFWCWARGDRGRRAGAALVPQTSLARLLAAGCFLAALALLMLSVAAPPAQIWYQALALLITGCRPRAS